MSGDYEGPHHYDVPLADTLDIIFSGRPASISFEAANRRHAHQWALFETVKLPEGKIVIPGVIELKSNFIEHPELIANRISNYAKLVGRENVIAGSDCGYGTWVGKPRSILTLSGRNSRHSLKALVLPPSGFGNNS